MASNTTNKLTDVYKALNSCKSFYTLNLDLKQELRDIFADTNNPDNIRNAALYEHGILHFQCAIDEDNNFNIESFLFQMKTDGNIIEYFESRISKVENPFILARYFHILWMAKKHNNYAKEAVKYYFLAKDLVISQKESNKNWTFDLLECLKRSFQIKCRVKNEIDSFNTEQEIINIASDFLDDEWGFSLSMRLLEIIKDSHKYFKATLSNDFINKINSYASKLIDKKESFQAIRILELIIKISEKMNYDTTMLLENLGVANEARVNDFNKSIASITYCIEAIRIYTKIKNNNKVEELKKTYEEISSNLKFGSIKTEINIESIINETKLQIVELLKYSTEDIILFLIYDKMFILSKDLIVSQATKEEKGILSIFFGGNYDIFDHRGNLVKICSTQEEKNWHKIMETYRWIMQIQRVSINLTLKELISNKKITIETLFNDLLNNTWLSAVFTISFGNGEEIKHSYANIIFTILKEYFRIFNAYISPEGLATTECLMFIDSATLKIEGLIRDLFTLSNFPTIVTDYSTGTTHEKDLNGLLHDENIKVFLDEDELLFFKYLFIEQEGLNLRNKIAHSLLLEQEYSVDIANMVFLALLKLFKFNIKNE